MQRSEQIGDLIAALAKAQSEFGSAIKESENPAFRSKYADLAANIGAVRPALSKNGIALMQFDETDLERQTASVTTALHYGEQFISITAEAPATGRNGFDVQSIGSCWTYLRRYTLQAICGLASEDDDGNSLQGNNPPIQRKTSAEVKADAQKRADALKPQAGKFLLADDLLQCVILSVKDSEKHLNVVFNGRVDGFNYAFCWHQSLIPALKSAVGKEVSIRIAPRRGEDKKSIQSFTIEDVISVEGVQYKNGKPDQLLTQLTASLEAEEGITA